LRELTAELPADSDSCAHAVNNAGMAAGSVDGQAAVWRNGAMLGLAVSGVATGINESGVVVGTMRLGEESTAPTHAFQWRDGVLTDLHPAGAVSSRAVAINESGEVAGTVDSRAVIWQNGALRELGFKPISVEAINDRGEVIGRNIFGDAPKAAPYIFNATLAPIPGGAGGDLAAPAVTNGGRVLVNGVDGYTTVIENGERLSFEFMPSMRAAGWKRLEPRAMNESGWIVGYGSHDFASRMFLITPVTSANPLLRDAARGRPLIDSRRSR
jgi:probable HAF family extracellular repeat protein